MLNHFRDANLSGRRRFAWPSGQIDALRFCWNSPASWCTWAAGKSLKPAGWEWYKTVDKEWTAGFEPVAKTIGSRRGEGGGEQWGDRINTKKLLKPFQRKNVTFEKLCSSSFYLEDLINRGGEMKLKDFMGCVCLCLDLWIYDTWNYNKHYSASSF